MSTLCGVIVDVDGTLVDSNNAHAQAWSQVLKEYGYAMTWEQVLPFVGMGGDKLLPKLTGVEADSHIGKAMLQRRKTLFQADYFPTLQPFPQARALLERMKHMGLTLAVGTSASSEEAECLLKLAGVDTLIDYVVTASDAENSKPDSDIIGVALHKMGCAAEQVLMLGDTPYDIEAAQKADVRTVAVLSGGWQTDELVGAIAHYQDAAALLTQFETSPFMPATP